jgi:hypothetical protein
VWQPLNVNGGRYRRPRQNSPQCRGQGEGTLTSFGGGCTQVGYGVRPPVLLSTVRLFLKKDKSDA